ncbi:signal peptide protein [Streptomyces hygroscopicus]|nr:signal peptide protein [Streptomyces hygroscopicus]
MTRYADIPKPIRSGIVVVDPDTGTPQRIIVLQFNPDTLKRSLSPSPPATAAMLAAGEPVTATVTKLSGSRAPPRRPGSSSPPRSTPPISSSAPAQR